MPAGRKCFLLLCLGCLAGAPSGLSAMALPTVSIDPQSLLFSPTLLGSTSESLSVSVSQNNPPLGLEIDKVILGDPQHFELIAENCTGSIITTGTNCALTVAFTPDQAGNYASNISFLDADGNVANFIPIEGIGVETLGALQPSSLPVSGTTTVKLSVTELDFVGQDVGQASAVLTISLTNTGTSNLFIKDITVGGDAPNSFSTVYTCSSGPVAPGASCSIQVIFTPAAMGSLKAALAVDDNTADSPHVIVLTGNRPVNSAAATNGGGCSLGSTADDLSAKPAWIFGIILSSLCLGLRRTVARQRTEE